MVYNDNVCDFAERVIKQRFILSSVCPPNIGVIGELIKENERKKGGSKMSKSINDQYNLKHLLNILNGDKTLELRKQYPKDFKGWYIFIARKGKPYYEKWFLRIITNQKML